MSLRILFILIVTIVIGTFAFPQPQQQQPQNRVGESPGNLSNKLIKFT